jgi:hypothetical protein
VMSISSQCILCPNTSTLTCIESALDLGDRRPIVRFKGARFLVSHAKNEANDRDTPANLDSF